MLIGRLNKIKLPIPCWFLFGTLTMPYSAPLQNAGRRSFGCPSRNSALLLSLCLFPYQAEAILRDQWNRSRLTPELVGFFCHAMSRAPGRGGTWRVGPHLVGSQPGSKVLGLKKTCKGRNVHKGSVNFHASLFLGTFVAFAVDLVLSPRGLVVCQFMAMVDHRMSEVVSKYLWCKCLEAQSPAS